MSPRLLHSLAVLILAASSSALAASDPCLSPDPYYTADAIVNAASNLQEPLAPLTWVSLYGCNLSYNSRGRGPSDVPPGFGGVNVLVNGFQALLSYISPGQINFLMPFAGSSATAAIQVIRDSDAGPKVTLTLADSSPELFLASATSVVAVHPDWTVVTQKSPASAGEIIVLYATGLGRFVEETDDMEVPALKPNPIKRRSEFQILLNGAAVEDRLIEYVGAAPLFIGVYQINLRLPSAIAADPEIRIALGKRVSMTGVYLPAAAAGPAGH